MHSPDRIVPVATNVPNPQIVNHHEDEVGLGAIFSNTPTQEKQSEQTPGKKVWKNEQRLSSQQHVYPYISITTTLEHKLLRERKD